MEALAALGLASNVVQFVTFASQLVSAGDEMYGSASGTTKRTIELEKIYSDLATFSSKLQGEGERQPWSLGFSLSAESQRLEDAEAKAKAHINALKALASDCRLVCDELLGVLKKLKVSGGRCRAFRSVMAAIRAVWDKEKVEDITARIGRLQSMMTLHFFPIISAQYTGLQEVATSLRRASSRLHLDQSLKLEEILRTLSNVEQSIKGRDDTVSISGPSATEIESSDISGAFSQHRVMSTASGSDNLRVLSEGVSAISLARRKLGDVAKEQAFLQNLNFPSRRVRHNNIPAAHERTFQWALAPPAVSVMGDMSDDGGEPQFARWLRQGRGIFWVTGRAGSGKSTFMKFVADHDLTRNLLEEWALPKKLVVADHYFWSAGTSMQKSAEGLLRTLLHRVFQLCPWLMSQVCPERWEQTHTRESQVDAEWTIYELRVALNDIAKRPDLGLRFCFFIDGIDEFGDDKTSLDLHDLCKIFQTLSQSDDIKLCLSSRPWNTFKDYFGQDDSQKINIHDLTYNDIREFTTSRLADHPRWNDMNFSWSDRASIIEEITDKANGVFLWVFLVTQNLRDGLSSDTMTDLQHRLRSLPPDLDQFFRHMLDVVAPFYSDKMAHTLRIAVNAREPLYFLLYSLHEHEYSDIDYALQHSSTQISNEDAKKLRDQCQRQINDRCGGLLEVKSTGMVEFLHRTVRDFLLGREMSDYLSNKSSQSFMVSVSTLKAYVAMMKRGSQLFVLSSAGTRELLRQALQYANDALDEDLEAAVEHLHELESYSHNWLAGRNYNWFDFNKLSLEFHEELLRAGVHKFVTRVMHQSPHYFDALKESPVHFIMSKTTLSPQHMQILRDLLKGEKEFMYITDTHRTLLQKRFLELFLDHMVASKPDLSTPALMGLRAKGDPRERAKETIADFLLHLGRNVGPGMLGELERVQARVRETEPARLMWDGLEFYAAIVAATVTMGRDLEWDMDFLLPTILESVPNSVATALGGRVRYAMGRLGPGRATGKRSLICVEDSQLNLGVKKPRQH